MKEEAHTIGEAVHALHRLASREVREQLYQFVCQSEEGLLNMRIGHKPELLNSFRDDYWSQTLTHLFFRGDCCEVYECHGKRQFRGRPWAKVLLKRCDFAGWKHSKEFAAMAANIFLRRQQMWGVHRHMTSAGVQRSFADLATIAPADFLNAALAAGECHSIRDASGTNIAAREARK